ncbi:ATP-grasp domain-containing protein [uncultured Thiocystis sp.]|jgi:biotin carboxylase|uniref:ATP-grasp domain-containing protein n=1 Tax=uncultured Thiocystis sp. TaxID=1202134 RepID=UPI0025FE478D|nr:ATP-grasp domain-containing protein [uncultured Thiocystis sp.]
MTRVWFNRTFSNVRAVFELIRQGDEAGEFHLVCSHTQKEFPGFLSAHEFALEPTGTVGDAYVEFCLDFCRERRIDFLWPGKAVALLAAHQARFAEQGVRVLTPASADHLMTLMDKARFYAEARRFSIPPPDFLEFRTADEFEAAYARLRASHEVLCVKPAEGVNGAGFRVIDEQRGGLEILLQHALYSIHRDGLRRILRESETFETLLLMEFLDGYEYSVDCVGDGRRLVAAVQRRKAKAGGYGQEIVDIPELTRAIGEMTEVFGLSGLFNAQFREGRNGFRLLEINPRFSGGIGYAGAIGVNLPYLALHGLTHGFPDQAHRVASGARVLELAHFRRIEDPF